MKPYVLEEDFMSIEFHNIIATLQRRPGVAEIFDGRISIGMYVFVRLGRDKGIELEVSKTQGASPPCIDHIRLPHDTNSADA
jgi:hypothetical protein